MARVIVKNGAVAVSGGRVVTDAGGAPCCCGPGGECFLVLKACNCDCLPDVVYLRYTDLVDQLWPRDGRDTGSVAVFSGVCYTKVGAVDSLPPQPFTELRIGDFEEVLEDCSVSPCDTQPPCLPDLPEPVRLSVGVPTAPGTGNAAWDCFDGDLFVDCVESLVASSTASIVRTVEQFSQSGALSSRITYRFDQTYRVQYDPFTFQTVLLDGVQRAQGTWDAGDGAGAIPFDCEKLLTPANIAESGTTLNDITTNPIGISARWFGTTPSTYCPNSALDQQAVRNFVGAFNYEPFLIPAIPCNDELSVESPCAGGASQCLNSDFAKTAVSFSAQGAYVRLERALQNQFSFSGNAVRRNEDYIYERRTQFEWQVSGGDTIPFSLCDQPADPDAGTGDIFADANPSDGGTDAGGPQPSDSNALSDLTDTGSMGLGDAVERAIKTITLNQLATCPACQRRKEVLNQFGLTVGRAVLRRLGW